MPVSPNPRLAVVSLVASAALLSVSSSAVLAQDEAEMTAEPVVVSFDFETDAQGWLPLLADLPEDYDPTVGDLLSEWRPLPENLEGHGLYNQGANRSDDLFMGWQGRVDGLEPATSYLVEANLTLVSSIPIWMEGLPDSPAEAWVKLGAVGYEPMAVVDPDGWLRLNAMKGQEAEGGRDAVVLGSVANPNLGEDVPDAMTFAPMELSSHDLGLTGTTDDEGSLWLFVGTDSGYEGFTVQYYDSIDVEFTPADPEATTTE